MNALSAIVSSSPPEGPARRAGPANDSLCVRFASLHLSELRAALRRTAPALRIEVAALTHAGHVCGVELHGSAADLARAMSVVMTALPSAEFGPAHGARRVFIP